MKSFFTNSKVKASPITSSPINSLTKNVFTRPFIPHPTNLSVPIRNQSLKTHSNSNLIQANKQQMPPVSFNFAKLTPLNDNSESDQENEKKLPILNNLEKYKTVQNSFNHCNPVKPQQNEITDSQQNSINNNEPLTRLGFLSKQYLLLKEKKIILEDSLGTIYEYIQQIEEYKQINGQSKSMDTYDKIYVLSKSLANLFDYWNTATYATLFSDLSEKTELLQSYLSQLSTITQKCILSSFSTRIMTSSKSVSSSLIAQTRVNKFSCINKTIETPNVMICEIQRIISSILTGIITISRVHTAICFSDKRDKPDENQDKSKSTIGEFSESLLNDETDKTDQNETKSKELISEIQEIDKNEENFICRICEEVVPLDLIEEHSALCIKAHQSQYHFYLCGEKLKKIKNKIDETVLSVNWPAEQEQATNVIFPILFYYSLINLAIDVQTIDCDASSQLETIIQELTHWELPKAECKNLKLYLIGAQLVNKKLQFFKEISNTAKKISSTTRRHRASTTGGFLTNLSDFEIIARLSSGAYARVFLSRKNRTGDLFAIKVIKREHMSQKNQLKAVSAERDIMKRLNSPFIVNFCM